MDVLTALWTVGECGLEARVLGLKHARKLARKFALKLSWKFD
jgi:hypothetical protein